MKWNNNGIKYRRGDYECLIARFDGAGVWFVNRGMMTQQTMKSCFKALGEALNAKTVEVKKLYNENDCETEEDVIVVMRRYDGSYSFYLETEERLEKIEGYDLKTIANFFRERTEGA